MSYSMRRKNVGKHTRREVIFYRRQAKTRRWEKEERSTWRPAVELSFCLLHLPMAPVWVRNRQKNAHLLNSARPTEWWSHPNDTPSSYLSFSLPTAANKHIPYTFFWFCSVTTILSLLIFSSPSRWKQRQLQKEAERIIQSVSANGFGKRDTSNNQQRGRYHHLETNGKIIKQQTTTATAEKGKAHAWTGANTTNNNSTG